MLKSGANVVVEMLNPGSDNLRLPIGWGPKIEEVAAAASELNAWVARQRETGLARSRLRKLTDSAMSLIRGYPVADAGPFWSWEEVVSVFAEPATGPEPDDLASDWLLAFLDRADPDSSPEAKLRNRLRMNHPFMAPTHNGRPMKGPQCLELPLEPRKVRVGTGPVELAECAQECADHWDDFVADSWRWQSIDDLVISTRLVARQVEVRIEIGLSPDSASAFRARISGGLEKLVDWERKHPVRVTFQTDGSIEIRRRGFRDRTILSLGDPESSSWVDPTPLLILETGSELAETLREWTNEIVPNRNTPSQQGGVPANGPGGQDGALGQQPSQPTAVADSKSANRNARGADSGIVRDVAWKDVQLVLLGMCERGDQYPGERALALTLGCSPSTVHKALTTDPPGDDGRTRRRMEAWVQAEPLAAPKATGLDAPEVINARQGREEDPRDLLPDDDVDTVMAKLIDEAPTPADRAKLHSLKPEERRELVRAYLAQKGDLEPSPLDDDPPGPPRKVKQPKRA